MDFQAVAQQLRKPDGDIGRRVGKKMNEGNLWIYRHTLDALNLEPNQHVLEIGMGNGAFVKDLMVKENSIKYVGCDFSPTMVEEARMLNNKLIATGQAEFFESSLDNLPFAIETFDVIFTVNTIYFWDSLEKELKEIKRILKQDGKFIIALRPKSIMKDMPFVKYGFNLYEKEDLQTVLSKNGFQVTQILERKEPDQDMEGIVINLATLILISQKY